MEKIDCSYIKMLNEYIGNEIKKKDFSISNLFDNNNENYFYSIVSKVKELLTSNKTERGSHQNDIKGNTMFFYELDTYSTNKILRMIMRKEKKDYYFGNHITSIVIYLNNWNYSPLLLFSMLFLYALKFLSINKIVIASHLKNNDILSALVSYYVELSPHIVYLKVNAEMNYLYEMIACKNNLVKIKLCVIPVNFDLLNAAIKNCKTLQDLSLSEIKIEGSKESFELLVYNLIKLPIKRFKLKNLSKFLPSKIYLTTSQLCNLFRLNYMDHLVIQDIGNEINDKIIDESIYNYNLPMVRTQNEYLNILVRFTNFSRFLIFNITSYKKIDIGPLDKQSFNNLAAIIKKNRTIKEVSLRFKQGNFDNCIYDNIFIQDKVSFYNLEIEDLKKFIRVFLLNNRFTKEFVLCSLNTIIPNKKEIIPLRNLGIEQPFYYDFGPEESVNIFIALKFNKYTSVIYKKKRIRLLIIKYLLKKVEMKFYLENKTSIYFSGFNFLSNKFV